MYLLGFPAVSTVFVHRYDAIVKCLAGSHVTIEIARIIYNGDSGKDRCGEVFQRTAINAVSHSRILKNRGDGPL